MEQLKAIMADDQRGLGLGYLLECSFTCGGVVGQVENCTALSEVWMRRGRRRHWKLDWKLDWERLNHSLGHGFDAGQRRQLWEDDSGLSQQGQIECVAEGDEMAVTGARLERIGCAPGVEGKRRTAWACIIRSTRVLPLEGFHFMFRTSVQVGGYGAGCLSRRARARFSNPK